MSHIHPPGRRPYCLRSNDAQRGRNTGDAYGPVSRLLLTYHRTHRRARSQRYASSAPPLRSLSPAGEPRGPFPTRFSLSPATAAKRGGACALNSHQRSLPGPSPINTWSYTSAPWAPLRPPEAPSLGLPHFVEPMPPRPYLFPLPIALIPFVSSPISQTTALLFHHPPSAIHIPLSHSPFWYK
jgi:hypothetical protein